MIHTDYAIGRVRAYLKEFGVAKSKLAAMAGIPEGSTRNIHGKEWNPTTETLRKLEAVIPNDYQPVLKNRKHKSKHKRSN